MAQDPSDKLNLPATAFPMRANLPAREPARVAHWEKIALYDAIQRKNAASPNTFILHDGPPFTNGDVHIGTALNKTLKDLTLRFKSMRGFRAPYIPGWDCHGLPIEQKVTRELREEGKIPGVNLSTAELRARCDAFSENWIARQKASFKRLGVLADWSREYKTKAPAYEAGILNTFAAFLERGLVYRAKKPVYWSIPFETALAEAEIEYKEHTSLSIWVKFPVSPAEAAKFNLPTGKPLSVLIWTTTPWTLPANLAIAVHPDVDYTVADLGAERILVAAPLLNATLAAAGIDPATVATTPPVKGAALEHLAATHPFINRPSPVVLANYVTTDSGTGCVHTAPGHGAEDYLTGLKYHLEIYCPVGPDGKYLDDGRVPPDLAGLSTLESVEDLAAKKNSPANSAVLKKLAAANALLAKAKITHSYPHCWRSKTPIIFRAVDQWFVSLDKQAADTATPRAEALHAIAGVNWIPAWGAARIRAAVETRPDWCVSRQRSWGVPIPAFYDTHGNARLDASVTRAIAAKIATRGTNWWFDNTAAEILSGIPLPPDWPDPASLAPGRDTLDVWLDSGSSHAATVRNYPETEQAAARQPADLYLEGTDQHRGWFQSSLWCNVIAAHAAPYKAVLTHGFIVGKDGRKISKSGQYEKPPTSDNYIHHYGADVIRLWVASQDFTRDITVSDLDRDLKDKASILNIVAENYRLLRNTLRYQLSNLHDFNPAAHALPLARLDTLDQWALHQTARLVADVTAAFDACEYHRAIQHITHFASATLSATYHDIIKDRLYTHPAASPARRSTQTALHHILATLTKLLAPVLTFTTDEAWSFLTANTEFTNDSIHLQDWPAPPAEWTNPALETEIAALLKLRNRVTEAIEPLRAAGQIGKSLDALVTLDPSQADLPLLQKHHALLPELLIVSDVRLGATSAPPAETRIAVARCQDNALHRCPRCWRWVPALRQPAAAAKPPVCPRCADALDQP